MANYEIGEYSLTIEVDGIIIAVYTVILEEE